MGPQLHRCGKRLIGHGYDLKPEASMGPQLHRCGKAERRAAWSVAPKVLQWGRNFIVAERASPWTAVQLVVPLQWGRNFIVAERVLNVDHF